MRRNLNNALTPTRKMTPQDNIYEKINPGYGIKLLNCSLRFSVWTFVGALIGNLIYGLLHDRLYEKFFPPGKMVLPTT